MNRNIYCISYYRNGFYTELHCTIPVRNLWPYLKTGKSIASLNLESQNSSLGGTSGGLKSSPLFSAELILTLEQAAWGFAQRRLGHHLGPRLGWFAILLGDVFSCWPGGTVHKLSFFSWTPPCPTLSPPGKFLPWLTTSKGPVPLLHLLAIFFHYL